MSLKLAQKYDILGDKSEKIGLCTEKYKTPERCLRRPNKLKVNTMPFDRKIEHCWNAIFFPNWSESSTKSQTQEDFFVCVEIDKLIH